jgi:outer membrane lipoprotein-sorting protein
MTRAMSMGAVFLFVFCMLHIPGASRAEGLSAGAIARKSDEALNRSSDAKADMLMRLLDKDGSVRERRLASFAKRYPGGERKSLIVFSSPADVKGTSFLSWTSKGKDDMQWLYLPSIGKVRQIGASDKGRSFLGSDFSYYDMASKDVDDLVYAFVKEEDLEGAPCYVIESRPGRVKVYGRVVSWIRKDNFLPVKMDICDMDGRYLKQGLFGKIQSVSGIPTATHLEMRAKDGSSTTIDLSSVRYDMGIPDSVFTQRGMQK